MKPEKKENVIFSYLALIFIGILVVTLVVLAYLDNKKPEVVQNGKPTPTPKANILTEEEMQTELGLLSERGSSPTQVVEYETNDSETSVSSSNAVGNDSVTENSNTQSYSYTPVYSVTTNSETESVLSYSGTIYNIQENIVIINNESGFIKVKIENNTNMTINGKNIDISSLEPAQKVHVEGYGNPDTKELRATTLTVLGEIQVIPF